jgi:hypothetical protein
VAATSRALQTLRDKVERYLNEHFGTYSKDGEGDYTVDFGETRVFVCPRPWSQDKTIVQLFTVLNTDLPLSGELTHFLCSENLNLLFGHFALHKAQRQVWFGHTLLGDFLDPDELVTGLSAVALSANKYAPLIQSRFGGQIFRA